MGMYCSLYGKIRFKPEVQAVLFDGDNPVPHWDRLLKAFNVNEVPKEVSTFLGTYRHDNVGWTVYLDPRRDVECNDRWNTLLNDLALSVDLTIDDFLAEPRSPIRCFHPRHGAWLFHNSIKNYDRIIDKFVTCLPYLAEWWVVFSHYEEDDMYRTYQLPPAVSS